MPQHSAGLLLHRGDEVYLGHMGGPFWSRKDAAAWSIPKGLLNDGEQPLDAALREFEEEIGAPPPVMDYRPLGDFRYSSGKVLTVFAGETDAPMEFVGSSTFELEWPPRSGRLQQFAEIDRAEWMPREVARTRLVAGQVQLLDAL